MELFEDRVINGLLKEVDAVDSPETGASLLAKDVEVLVDPAREGVSDLWPCVWALTVALSKQFTGKIYLRTAHANPFPRPAVFSKRVVYGSAPASTRIRVGLGTPGPDNNGVIWGDTRGDRLTFGAAVDARFGVACPAGCFALAGYLGFAALAEATGIPPFREELAQPQIVLPGGVLNRFRYPQDGLAILGLGQLGQAFLSLLYFLARGSADVPRVYLLDKDEFESPNRFTQVLLSEDEKWEGVGKAPFLEEKVNGWGWQAFGERRELRWGDRPPRDGPHFAMVGFHDLEARRIAAESGYSWLVEAGVGTSLSKPRITWHSLPGERGVASQLFAERAPNQSRPSADKRFFQVLRDTPGQCGWVTFQNIQATAPSMGLVAAAYASIELAGLQNRQRTLVSGSAFLWSPLLPFLREEQTEWGVAQPTSAARR